MIARARTLAIALSLPACRVEYVVPAGDSDGACADDEISCGELCTDLDSDPHHCGSCGNACGMDDVCDEGECRSSCSDGRDACDRQCVDVEHDPDHCGACGNACGETQVCEDGLCRDD